MANNIMKSNRKGYADSYSSTKDDMSHSLRPMLSCLWLLLLLSLLGLVQGQQQQQQQQEAEFRKCKINIELSDVDEPHNVLNEHEYRLLVNRYQMQLPSTSGNKPLTVLPSELQQVFQDFQQGGEIDVIGVRNGQVLTDSQEVLIQSLCSRTVATLQQLLAPTAEDNNVDMDSMDMSLFQPNQVLQEDEETEETGGMGGMLPPSDFAGEDDDGGDNDDNISTGSCQTDYNIGVDIQIRFQEEGFFAGCLFDEEESILATIETAIQEASYDNWDLGKFMFDEDLEVNNANPFSIRRLDEDEVACPPRTIDCDDETHDFCRWGCFSGILTSCDGSLDWSEALAEDIQANLANLGFDCLGSPDDLSVFVDSDAEGTPIQSESETKAPSDDVLIEDNEEIETQGPSSEADDDDDDENLTNEDFETLAPSSEADDDDDDENLTNEEFETQAPSVGDDMESLNDDSDISTDEEFGTQAPTVGDDMESLNDDSDISTDEEFETQAPSNEADDMESSELDDFIIEDGDGFIIEEGDDFLPPGNETEEVVGNGTIALNDTAIHSNDTMSGGDEFGEIGVDDEDPTETSMPTMQPTGAEELSEGRITILSAFVVRSNVTLALDSPEISILDEAFLRFAEGVLQQVADDQKAARRRLRLANRRLVALDANSAEVYAVEETPCRDNGLMRFLQEDSENTAAPSDLDEVEDMINTNAPSSDLGEAQQTEAPSDFEDVEGILDLQSEAPSALDDENASTQAPTSTENTVAPTIESTNGTSNPETTVPPSESTATEPMVVDESVPVCMKMSARYDLILEEGENEEEIRARFANATMELMESGALSDALTEVDPDARFSIVGASSEEPQTEPPESSGETAGNATNTGNETAGRDAPTEAPSDDGGTGMLPILAGGIGAAVLICCCGIAFIYIQKRKQQVENDEKANFSESDVEKGDAEEPKNENDQTILEDDHSVEEDQQEKEVEEASLAAGESNEKQDVVHNQEAPIVDDEIQSAESGPEKSDNLETFQDEPEDKEPDIALEEENSQSPHEENPTSVQAEDSVPEDIQDESNAVTGVEINEPLEEKDAELVPEPSNDALASTVPKSEPDLPEVANEERPVQLDADTPAESEETTLTTPDESSTTPPVTGQPELDSVDDEATGTETKEGGPDQGEENSLENKLHESAPADNITSEEEDPESPGEDAAEESPSVPTNEEKDPALETATLETSEEVATAETSADDVSPAEDKEGKGESNVDDTTNDEVPVVSSEENAQSESIQAEVDTGNDEVPDVSPEATTQLESDEPEPPQDDADTTNDEVPDVPAEDAAQLDSDEAEPKPEPVPTEESNASNEAGADNGAGSDSNEDSDSDEDDSDNDVPEPVSKDTVPPQESKAPKEVKADDSDDDSDYDSDSDEDDSD